MDSLILAGGKCPDDLRQATSCELRAELPFRGVPSARLVADVIKAVAPEGKTFVVGYEIEGCANAPAGKSFVDSLRNGLVQIESEAFLLAAADLPFLKAESVRHFVNSADPKMLINYPIIPLDLCEKAFPGMKRTAIRLREGRFTGGNVGVANTNLMRSILPILDEAYANRKKPLRLAAQVGLGTLARLALGQVFPAMLPLAALEKAVGKFLGGSVRAIPMPYPDLGADVDNLTQYQQALQLLGEKAP
jgi:hypothetical protein